MSTPEQNRSDQQPAAPAYDPLDPPTIPIRVDPSWRLAQASESAPAVVNDSAPMPDSAEPPKEDGQFLDMPRTITVDTSVVAARGITVAQPAYAGRGAARGRGLFRVKHKPADGQLGSQSAEVRPDVNLSETDRSALRDLFDRPEMAAVWGEKDKTKLGCLALDTFAESEFEQPLPEWINGSFDRAVSGYARWYTTGDTLQGRLNRFFRDRGGWHVAREWENRAMRGTEEDAVMVVEEAMAALADHLLALRASLNEPSA